MILENPALTLNISVDDILDILESTLKERNWKHFELANLKLTYVPFYIFNYDTLVEQEVSGQTYSQGFSGVMAMNAVSGKLEPLLTDIMEKQPVEYEKEISHDLQYDMLNPSLFDEELKSTCKIKLAGQFNVGRNAMAVSGFRLVYWPIWKIFVTLPNKRIQKIEVEAVSGYPMNIEEVPEKELTWMEVTSDTLAKMKTKEGLKDLSKTIASVTASGIKGATGKPTKSKAGGTMFWLTHSKSGKYLLLGLIVIIFILLFLEI